MMVLMTLNTSIANTSNLEFVYAPQVGCGEEEKDIFWRQKDQELRAIPERERVIVGVYLNGHVGINRVAIERIPGGWGVKERGPR